MKKKFKDTNIHPGIIRPTTKTKLQAIQAIVYKKSQHLNQKAQKDERMEKYIPGKSNSANKQLICLTSVPHSVALLFIMQPSVPRYPCPLVLCIFGQCEALTGDKRVERMRRELFFTQSLAAFSSRQLPLESLPPCFQLLMGSSCCDLATALIEPASGLQSTGFSPGPSSPGDANTFLLLLPYAASLAPLCCSVLQSRVQTILKIKYHLIGITRMFLFAHKNHREWLC